MQAWQRIVLALVLVGALGGLALRSLSEEGGEPTTGALRYKTVVAEQGPFRIAIAASGLVRPIDRIELKSKASGEVIELPIEVGDAVEEGALIARLDPTDARAGLDQARADLAIADAELQLADKNFKRRQELFSRKVISKESKDQTELDRAVARGKHVQAKTALASAQERLDETVIRAPVAGTILQKYVERGQIIASGVSTVGGGTPIADIADMQAVHIEAGVDEIDIGRIQVGQVASVRAEAYPEERYRGEVVRIAPEARVEQNVTLFDVIIRVENTDGNLKSGMNSSVEVVIVDEEAVLTVPVAALRRGEPSTVWVADGDGWVEREVRVGRTNHAEVEILEGVAPGQELGIPMGSRLKDANDRLDARIRESRSFGRAGGGKSTTSGGKASSSKGSSGHP